MSDPTKVDSAWFESGDVTAVVRVTAKVAVEYPATAGSVVDWVRDELSKLGFDDVLTRVEAP